MCFAPSGLLLPHIPISPFQIKFAPSGLKVRMNFALNNLDKFFSFFPLPFTLFILYPLTFIPYPLSFSRGYLTIVTLPLYSYFLSPTVKTMM